MGTWRNPILVGCHPDPSVCRVGDEYFLVTSTFEYLPGLPIHRSSNLVDWEPVGHAIHREGQLDLSDVRGSKGLYAPTIRHHGGRFHVVCTVVGGKERSGHFLVTATDAAGPWSDPIWFDGLEGIDPSLTFDGDRVWLCGTRQANPQGWSGHGEIWLVELDPETFAVLGKERIIWEGAVRDAGWAEGPHLVERPDRGWMLVAAEGGTDRDHAVCVAYADDITGPYFGDPGNPRLSHRALGDRTAIANVGHADLVEAPDGRWWSTMLGTQTPAGRNGLLGRQTHLVPVEWESGRILFAPGSARVESTMTADGVPDQAAPRRRWRDDFDGGALDHAWNSVDRLPAGFVDLDARPGWLRIAASHVAPTELGPLAFLGRRLPDHRVEVTAAIDATALVSDPRAAGDDRTARAGILLRTSELEHVELALTVDAIELASTIAGVRTVASRASRSSQSEAPMALRLRVEGLSATAFCDDVEVGAVDLSHLATGRPSMFVGCWIGPFAVGSGVIDVDLFDIVAIDD